MSARKRPLPRRSGVRIDIKDGSHKLHLSTGEYPDGSLAEIFCVCSKEGAFVNDAMSAFAIATSLALQYGAPLPALTHAFRNFKASPDLFRIIFNELEQAYVDRQETAYPDEK